MSAWAVQAEVKDPIADILDVYAFMNPPCRTSGGKGCEAPPEELILAFTVNRSATTDTRFSDSVVYHINFENDVGIENRIDCSISAEQVVTCAGLNGLSVSAPVGEVGENGNIRVFAGLRDDPFFLDVEAVQGMETLGVGAFRSPGVDYFAGSNVMAIVVGIKNSAFPAGSGAVDSNGHKINVQKTWVSSERTMSNINAGATGSWYNPELSGQGWVIEKLSSGQFVFYFYGYDDMGELLWLLGVADDTGDGVITVNTLRFTGTGFGGNFNPASNMNESVGSMTFEFTDCNNATVDFVPTSVDLSAFSIPVQRLTSIDSLDCIFVGAGQVDRAGRPIVRGILPEGIQDAYSTASVPAAWPSLYTADFTAALTAVDLADGIPGNYFNSPAVLAPILADDRLGVDLEWSACLGIWGFELSALVPQPNTNDCGGRGLTDNVLEEFLSMVVSGFDPLYDDNVTANDVPFLTEFPFLAAPH